jgi:menaquinone-9 beta-reductase
LADVIVVGAGPAGASTAIRLSRRGLRVRLLERARVFPRSKGCGEGLFPRGVEALDEMGALGGILARAKVLTSLRLQLDYLVAEGPLGTTAYPAIGVRRDILDTALVDLSRRSGVEVCLGVTANDLLSDGTRYRGVRTNHGDFEAELVVLADGQRSRLRRIAGLDARGTSRRYGVSAHYLLPHEPAATVHIRLMGGYEIYLTPVGERLVNVALLASKARSTAWAGRLSEAYDSAVEASGVLSAGAELIEAPVASGPFPAGARRSWRSNLLLVGDAAHFYDGISGEGMSLALSSARHAAGAIAAFLQDGHPEHFERYDRVTRAEARNSTLLARISLWIASHPASGRRVIERLARNPALFSKLLGINAGSCKLSSLTPADVVRFILPAR